MPCSVDGQKVPADQHRAEIARAYPCAARTVTIAVAQQDSIGKRLEPLACSLVRQAMAMVAAGRASHVGVSPADTVNLRFASVVEFRFQTMDRSGRDVPGDVEEYWATALLFANPTRTIEYNVWIGTRVARFRRTHPMDTTLKVRRGPGGSRLRP